MQTEKQSIYSTLVYGAFVSIIGKFIGVGLQFFSQIILARYLGPSDFGYYSVGWSFFQIAGVVATFGLDYAVIKFGAQFWPNQLDRLKIFIKKINLFALLVSISSTAIIFIFSGMVLNWLGKNDYTIIFRLFSAGIPLYVFSKLNSATTRISQNIAYSTIAEEIVRRGSQFVFIVLIVRFSLGLRESILLTNLSFGLSAILGGIFVYHLFIKNISNSNYPISLQQTILKYTLLLTGSSFTSSILIWFDRILLGIIASSYQAGLYQAASQITLVFSTILLAINLVAAPMIASYFHKNDIDGLENIFHSSTKWILYLSLPLILVLFVFPSLVLESIFGNSYTDSAPLLIILTITQVINLGTGVVAQVMLMTKFEKKWFWYTLFSSMLNIIGNLFLIPKFGPMGAAIGSGISLSVLNFLGVIKVYQSFKILPIDKRIGKGIIATLISLFTLLLTNNFFNPQGIVFTLLVISISYICFFLSLFVLGFDQEDRDFINQIKNRSARQEPRI